MNSTIFWTLRIFFYVTMVPMLIFSLCTFFAGGWFCAAMWLTWTATVHEAHDSWRMVKVSRKMGLTEGSSDNDWLLQATQTFNPQPRYAVAHHNGTQDFGQVVSPLGYTVPVMALPEVPFCGICSASYPAGLPRRCRHCGENL